VEKNIDVSRRSVEERPAAMLNFLNERPRQYEALPITLASG